MLKSLLKRKKLLVIGLVCFAGLFVYVVGPWPQYHEHYKGTEYYEETLDRWENCRRSLVRPSRPDIDRTDPSDAPDNSPFEIGFASVKITPPKESPLRALDFTEGIHDDCWVKAIAFSDGKEIGVIASADLLIVSKALSSAVMEELHEAGLKDQQVYFSTTHTHNGPGGWGSNFLERAYTGKRDRDVFLGLRDAFCEAILQARSQLRPATLSFGRVSVPEAIRNRAFGDEGEVDDELSFIAGKRLSDGKRYHVAIYAAHACNIWGKDNYCQTSADYPGRFRQIVEAKTGGFCAFLAGGVGSMATNCPTGESDFQKIEWIATHLSNRLLEASEGLETLDHVQVRTAKLDLLMPPFQTKLFSDKLRLSPFYMNLVGGRQTYLKLLGLNDLVLIGTPSDFSGELALEVKAYGRSRGLSPVVTSFNGDYHGYILPDKYYRKVPPMPPKGGLAYYETNLMSFHGPYAGSYTVEFMNRLLQAYASI